ncbi:hypothetical protein VNO77_19287 [Canavalia gladiata]|uniref:Uncharacterized protein n=1 Tax=Canavalia gladiata TaxID=3824 RepID=A0AAN9LSA8_CANGL
MASITVVRPGAVIVLRKKTMEWNARSCNCYIEFGLAWIALVPTIIESIEPVLAQLNTSVRDYLNLQPMLQIDAASSMPQKLFLNLAKASSS